MPAVVRVKRRIDEEPLGAFVLNGKKRRLDGDFTIATTSSGSGGGGGSGDSIASGEAVAKDEISTILKFAGTIHSQDHGAISQLARLSKDEAKQLVQQKSRKPINHTERARQEMRASLHENRFRVVNCLRTTLEPLIENQGASIDASVAEPKELTIVDIEKHAVPVVGTAQTSCVMPSSSTSATTSSTSAAAAAAAALSTTANICATHDTANTIVPAVGVDATQPSDSDTGYVYDLYLPENEQQAAYVDLMDDNYLSVRAFDNLVYEDRFNNDVDDEYDSEDSNQENCAGNEYPDEDDDRKMFGSDRGDCDDDDEYDLEETEDTRELRQAVRKFILDESDDDGVYGDDNCDRSSEDDDHTGFNDPYVHSVNGIEDKSFVDDVDRYGLAYARYKARILKKKNAGANDDDDDDDDGDDEDDVKVKCNN